MILIFSHYRGATSAIDRLKFERTAGSFVKEVVNLGVLGLLLSCSVVALVSSHFGVLSTRNTILLLVLIGRGRVRRLL